LRLPVNLRHGLFLWYLILKTPPDPLHHELNQRHQDKNDQKNDLTKAQISHNGLP
jgi:hypothetical protein